MDLVTRNFAEQSQHWPSRGRHILAQYDDESVVVYQAYRPAIGRFAAEHGYFGGEFKLTRMSWVKPNFCWMMYRSGWGTKEGQEITLAVRIRRSAFDEILAGAVHATYVESIYGDRHTWKSAVAGSDVRLQWDPDHAPDGRPLERRAIQLGLRGDVLRSYAREWIVSVTDISEFVAQQRSHLGRPELLSTPSERVYPVTDPAVAARLGIAALP